MAVRGMLRRARRSALGVALGTALCAVPAAAQEAGHVGQERCLGCHAGVWEGYGHTAHAKVFTPENARGARMALGCEACHGPGAAHAGGERERPGEAWVRFGDPSREAVGRANQACLQCHGGGGQRHWEGSAHESRGLACTSCHSVKQERSPRHLLAKSDEAALCRDCHALPGSQMLRSSHMPSRAGRAGAGGEGFMTCSSCHNTHGTIADALIDAHTVNDSCYGCHAEKRGPFLWEHAPVSESCTNCHVPHGSLKPSMLKIAGPRLCQTCHIQTLHPSEARLSGSRFVVGRNCAHCHVQVHGSNHPSGTFLTR